MDLLDLSFKGNKNEMGQTLGSSMPIVCYADSTSDSTEQTSHTNMHASLTLRGNKNETGSKLGSIPQKDEMFMNRTWLITMRLMTNKLSQNSLMNVHISHVTQHYQGTIPRLLKVLKCYDNGLSTNSETVPVSYVSLTSSNACKHRRQIQIVLSKTDIYP